MALEREELPTAEAMADGRGGGGRAVLFVGLVCFLCLCFVGLIGYFSWFELICVFVW